MATLARHRHPPPRRRLGTALGGTPPPHRRRGAANPTPDPEETAVTGAVAKSVQAAVEDLPAAQREAIRLAYFDGPTYRQVAETLGIPEGTAKSRLWQGLRRLADRLQAEGIEP
jgi:RNA polymerase sigma factor (sigma-70 family)